MGDDSVEAGDLFAGVEFAEVAEVVVADVVGCGFAHEGDVEE